MSDNKKESKDGKASQKPSGEVENKTSSEDDSLYEAYEDEKEAKKPSKGKTRGIISMAILAVCAVVLVFSLYNIVTDLLDKRKTDEIVSDFQNSRLEYENQQNQPQYDAETGEQIVVPPAPETEGTVTTVDNRKSTVILNEVDNPDIVFFTTDLSDCLAKNEDTVAWLKFPDVKGKVEGLPIDLPVVHSGDNEYYLDHNFYKNDNINGWVFMDYRNATDMITDNYNTILYGHARSDNMFGGLKYLNEKASWYNNEANHYIYLKTPNEDTVWEIFAWYETSVEQETASLYNYIRTSFSGEDFFVEFCNVLQDKNTIPAFTKFEFDGDDRILTLSTCKSYDKDIRVVVHAKLVKLRVWE